MRLCIESNTQSLVNIMWGHLGRTFRAWILWTVRLTTASNKYQSNTLEIVLPSKLVRFGMTFLTMYAMATSIASFRIKSSKFTCLQKPLPHSQPPSLCVLWCDLILSMDLWLFNMFVYSCPLYPIHTKGGILCGSQHLLKWPCPSIYLFIWGFTWLSTLYRSYHDR